MYSTDYFSIIVSVLGGLAFFLYGMHLLGTGLEKAFGRSFGTYTGKK